MSVQGFPNGLWVNNNGTFQRTNFAQSQILSMYGVPVASHESTSATGLLNVSDFLDSSAYADVELGNRNLCAYMNAMGSYQQYMQTSGLTAPLGATYVTPFGQNPPALPGGSYTPPTFGGNPGVNPGGGTYTPPTFGGNPGVNPGGGTYTPPSFNPVNPFAPTNPYSPVNPTNPTNPTSPVNPYSPTNPYGTTGSGDLVPPAADNYGAQFNARLALIEEYCDKWGRTVDVDKIKADYASDPQAGVEYCDEILNDEFDQGRLRNIVEKHYAEFNKAREEAAQGVADNWVQAVLNQGLGALSLSTAGVDKNNVLDVIGRFAVNEDVKAGKVSLENVMESPEFTSQLIDTIKAKADEYLLNEDIDDSVKDALINKIASLRTNYDKYADSIADDDRHNDVEFNTVRTALAKDVFDMFAIMRTDEAKRNDEAAPQYYGLPEDTSITLDNQQVRARKEIDGYRSRTRLSINI